MASLQARSMALLALLCFFIPSVLAQGAQGIAVDPNNPGEVIRITVSGTIVAIVLMVAGFIFAFFGHKFFKITLFLAGFYVCSTLAWIALKNAEPAVGYENAQWIYLGVSGAAGLLGGCLFLCFWRLGFAALGAISGFYFAIFVLSWASSGVISNGTGRTIFIIACVIVGIVLTFFVERHVVILGTALVGSGSFFVGLDNFVHTGFSDAFIQFLSGKKTGLIGGDGYVVSGKVYGMLAGTLAMFVVGACFQYYKHRGSWVPKTHRPQYKPQPQHEQP
ncbi:hypothetical protein BX616_001228 [Lobosporangium transversale]|uniref:Transmembrane protein 198 n=1 Tax=Lobosporangium transversale TaxID=64571 RepID=A0A1Y2GZL2_9FUNG|nr:hypothetical protein BCR41DRAFT_346515 [Lobosporangium transversale]KAF9917368.1 hypothetical protein BX616_001228 [Lobosporangium transversale]ORZ27224.1 hypothetical protein BCR41DRAFT_346515 [Lobosporangium transversale]|eukprot:XP_021884951.1 hypothetical protein BCR41DRAFT_346515 [Lobosporangium transversale]